MPPLPDPSSHETPPHPQTRMAGEDRRRQLIEVAIDLFSRRGFAGTTTREIAAAAGVTEAIIFRHFTTKQDFYKAILDYKCQGKGASDWLAITQKFMDADDDEGLFRMLISTIVTVYREEPQFERLLLYAALEGHELAIMHHDQMKLPIGAKFREYILRRQQQGALRQCDPAVVLFALAGIPQFYAMQKYIHKHGDLSLTDEQVVDSFLLILMNGLKTTAPKGLSK
ncbi:MAG: TetR/AcrR family transcriptional regulator [Acidobacteriota bacterium]